MRLDGAHGYGQAEAGPFFPLRAATSCLAKRQPHKLEVFFVDAGTIVPDFELELPPRAILGPCCRTRLYRPIFGRPPPRRPLVAYRAAPLCYVDVPDVNADGQGLCKFNGVGDVVHAASQDRLGVDHNPLGHQVVDIDVELAGPLFGLT